MGNKDLLPLLRTGDALEIKLVGFSHYPSLEKEKEEEDEKEKGSSPC